MLPCSARQRDPVSLAAGGERQLRGKLVLSAPARRTAAAPGPCQASSGGVSRRPGSRPPPAGEGPRRAAAALQTARSQLSEGSAALAVGAACLCQAAGTAGLGGLRRSAPLASQSRNKSQPRKRPRGLPGAGFLFCSPQPPGKGRPLPSGSRWRRRGEPGRRAPRGPPRRPRSSGASQRGGGRQSAFPRPLLETAAHCGAAAVGVCYSPPPPTGPPPPGAGNFLAALSGEQRGRHGPTGARGSRAFFPFFSSSFPLSMPSLHVSLSPSPRPPRDPP